MISTIPRTSCLRISETMPTITSTTAINQSKVCMANPLSLTATPAGAEFHTTERAARRAATSPTC